MPISGPSSYLPVTDEILTHWEIADTTLGAGNEIVVQGGVARAGLETLRNSLETKRADVQAKLNLQETARGAIEELKAVLLLRLNQFNDKVRSLYAGSKWERSLPLVPSSGLAQSSITDPLDDAASLWLLMNADAGIPDITLLGGYTQAQFVTDLAALKTAYRNYNNTGTTLTVTREERNDLQDQIRVILVNYRKSLPTFFAAGHALVESMPVLSPARGSTPDAVVASATWDVTLGMAKITFTASVDPNLFQYEIRSCVGPSYSTDNETVIGNVGPTALREFLSLDNLSAPGSVVTYKVYVITTTGNEKGSNTVLVTRP